MYTAFLNSIKLSEYRTGIKFDKDALAVEQNNYLTKIVNVYIVYDLAKKTYQQFKIQKLVVWSN